MLDKFARLLGIRPDQAEYALQSERAAKLVVSRRSFLGVGAALATGALFSFGSAVEVVEPVITVARRASTLSTFDALLKERYSAANIDSLMLEPSPFFAMITKVDKGRGVITIDSAPSLLTSADHAFTKGKRKRGRWTSA